jgi:dCTP deaminase
MILSDIRILEEMEKDTIKIKPYNRECLGSNSYDCHLSKHLSVYASDEDAEMTIKELHKKYNTKTLESLLDCISKGVILDSKRHNKVVHFEIPENGLVFYPHGFYLGSTVEYTETHAHIPFIEGKSSTGRLSIDIHATAGKGDVGFCGYWTLELSVKQPVRVYAGMPIGQLIYFVVDGDVDIKYDEKKDSKYSGQGKLPKESMMWKNKFFEEMRKFRKEKPGKKTKYKKVSKKGLRKALASELESQKE